MEQSHDRRFLKNLTEQTIWLDRGCTKLMRKNFAHFEDWRDAELERVRGAPVLLLERALLRARVPACAALRAPTART